MTTKSYSIASWSRADGAADVHRRLWCAVSEHRRWVRLPADTLIAAAQGRRVTDGVIAALNMELAGTHPPQLGGATGES